MRKIPLLVHARMAILVGFVVALLVPFPVSGSAVTIVVVDPVGDVFVPAYGLDTPLNPSDYEDIVRAELTLKGKTFTWRYELAEPVPAEPALPLATVEVWWAVAILTDPGSQPGFPFSPGNPKWAPDFIVVVVWDGSVFAGILIDRRPLLTNQAAIITPIPFRIEGATIDMFVKSATLGDPSFIHSNPAILNWVSHPGTEGFFFVDMACCLDLAL